MGIILKVLLPCELRILTSPLRIANQHKDFMGLVSISVPLFSTTFVPISPWLKHKIFTHSFCPAMNLYIPVHVGCFYIISSDTSMMHTLQKYCKLTFFFLQHNTVFTCSVHPLSMTNNTCLINHLTSWHWWQDEHVGPSHRNCVFLCSGTQLEVLYVFRWTHWLVGSNTDETVI